MDHIFSSFFLSFKTKVVSKHDRIDKSCHIWKGTEENYYSLNKIKTLVSSVRASSMEGSGEKRRVHGT